MLHLTLSQPHLSQGEGGALVEAGKVWDGIEAFQASTLIFSPTGSLYSTKNISNFPATVVEPLLH